MKYTANKHYSEKQVLQALQLYTGEDERVVANIEKLMLVDAEQQHVVLNAVVGLANTLPKGGPVVAFEIICEVSRLMARKH